MRKRWPAGPARPGLGIGSGTGLEWSIASVRAAPYGLALTPVYRPAPVSSCPLAWPPWPDA